MGAGLGNCRRCNQSRGAKVPAKTTHAPDHALQWRLLALKAPVGAFSAPYVTRWCEN